MRTSSSIVIALSLALLWACDRKDEPAPVKSERSAKADPKAASKADAKTEAQTDTKTDTKTEPADPSDKEPRGKADDPASAKALDEFAKSRDEQTAEVTAKPGTAEWFVQGLAAFRAGDIDPIVSNFASGITWDAVGSPLEPPSVGKAAVLARWEDLLIGIPDMKLHARRIFHHGNLVVLQVVLTGTHKGNFRGIAPTDKPIGAEVLAWVWHDDAGKANRVRVVYDEATLLAQMGQIVGEPPPIPELPSAAPEIIAGDDDAAASKVLNDKYAAGKQAWKLCQSKLCASGFVSHDVRTGKQISSTAEHQAGHDAFFGAFPDLTFTVEDITSFGAGWVVSFVHAKGTHTGALGPMKATKKQVEFGHAELARLEGGKIAESWSYANSLDLLADLGLFSPPAAAPAEPPAPTPTK